MCSTIAVNQTLKRYPFHSNSCIAEALLQHLRLSAYSHDVSWCNGEEIIGIVHLVNIVDGDDFKASTADILHERQVLFPQLIFLCAWFARPDITSVELRVARLGIQPTAHHRTEIPVDDVEVSIKMHLHLPQLMVTHHNNGVMPKGISLHQLAYALVVSAHAAANERYVASRDVVATLQAALATDF